MTVTSHDHPSGTFTAWLFQSGGRADGLVDSYDNWRGQVDISSNLLPPRGQFDQWADLLHDALQSDSYQLSDRYCDLQLVGRGGMGDVFKATDKQSNQPRAIKVLHEKLVNSEVALRRFEREIQMLSELRHPHLVEMIDHGVTANGAPYLVMEWLEGHDISSVAESFAQHSVTQCIELFSQAADVLAYIHERGIIHRDIKPENLMIVTAPDGTAVLKLVDFGIARSSEIEDQSITSSQHMIGTPSFMSPEQCLGKPVDRRSDIYSFGCLMYEVVSGNCPFTGKNAVETLLVQLNGEVERPTISFADEVIQEGLTTVILRCLRKDPHERYQSMAELKEDLNLLLSGQPVKTHQFAPNKAKGKAKLGRTLFACASLVILSTAVLAVSGNSPSFRSDRQSWQQFSLQAQRELDGGRYDRAQENLNEALRIARKQNNDTLRKSTLKDLADTLFLQGQPDTAAFVLTEAMTESSIITPGIRNLNQQLKEALQSITTSNTESGMARYELLCNRANDTATFMIDQTQYKQAAEVLIATGEIASKAFPPDHPIALRTWHNLGYAAHSAGYLSKAEEYYLKALRYGSRQHIINYAQRGKTLYLLAKIYGYQGKHEAARELLQDSLGFNVTVFGAESEQVAAARLELAECLIQLEASAEALRQLEQARSYYESHEDTNLNRRARLYFFLASLHESRSLLRKSLDCYEQETNKDYHYIARVLLKLGSLSPADEAVHMYRRVVAMSAHLVPAEDALRDEAQAKLNALTR